MNILEIVPAAFKTVTSAAVLKKKQLWFMTKICTIYVIEHL